MSFPTTKEAISLLERGRAREAASLLRRLVERTPGHVTAYVLLARAYEADGRPRQAHTTWQQAGLLMPNSPVVAAGRRRTRRAARRAAAPPEGKAAAPTPKAPPPSFPDDDELLEAVPSQAHKMPEGRAAPLQDFDDLDTLIQELEGARINPDPEPDAATTPDLEDDLENMVSETLARIYAAQGQHAEAARVYRRLAEQHPDRADAFNEKAREMNERARR